MNQEQLEIFNENVRIENKNTEILTNNTMDNRNAIIAVFDYVQNVDFWWMVILFIVFIYMIMMNIRLNKLEDRVEDIEERRPELEPLLAQPTKV